MSNVVLAVDLGGTNLRMAAVSHDGDVLHLARAATPKDVLPDQLIDLTSQMADECRAAITNDDATIRGIAFAAPAPAAADSDGVLVKLPNLPSLNGMNLKDDLFARFRLPVTLENDATAAAIGENWLGASKDVPDSIMFTLGTGVGGGIIINNAPLRGIDGSAGEIGHFCIEPEGHPCGCGSRGCIEQYASATAIVRMARENGLASRTSLEVYQAAQNADERALAVFRKMGSYLGIIIAGLVNALNPEMVVIGGGAAAGWDQFIEHVKKEVRDRSFREPAERVQIVRSKLGDNAGILGAARSAFLSFNV